MVKPEFASVLDMTADDIERPQPLPPGHYTCMVRERPIQDKSSQKETPYVEFTLYPIEPHEDVEEDWLEKVLKRANGERKKLSDVPIRARFYTTDDAAWRLKKFLLEDLQIENEGQTIGQLCEEAVGHQVVAYIKHRSQDGNTFVDLKATSPVNAPEPKKTARR